METRDSFVFYRSFYDVVKTLDDKDKVYLLEMICQYGLNRVQFQSENKLLSQLFTLIKPQLDANYRKAIGGKKGGRPKNKPMVKPMVSAEDKPMGKPNVNENANDSFTGTSFVVDQETGEVKEILY